MIHSDAVDHLEPIRWARVNRALAAKALAEFSHERLLAPLAVANDGVVGAQRFQLVGDDPTVEYGFTARVLTLDHWQIDPTSITRTVAGEQAPVDAVQLILDLRQMLGLNEVVLPVYVEEITATLASAAYKLGKPAVAAAELAGADFQAIETGMSEGHPCFVANNGRIGLGVTDFRDYAPEAAQPVRLVWLAAHRERSNFTACVDLTYDQLMHDELGERTLDRFARSMSTLGLDLADYHLLPVHPWQWDNKLAVTFAGEVAQRRLVHLGEGEEAYLAQQSIRTFANISDPAKHYVKTALSVLNMGFMRGLSAEYMAATPAINDWLGELVATDPVLKDTGLTIIRERAAIGYHHEHYDVATPAGSPYRKMLAALWRESAVPTLKPGQRLATMASLLHHDADGASLAAALVQQSGLEPVAWLRRYLDAYLVPLLHSLFAYDLAFMPHGENVILVLEGSTVVRVVFKDLAEEVCVMDADAPLPEQVRRIQVDVPVELRALSIFTDVFDCFFRFLAAALDQAGTLTQEQFWATVAQCVRDYQESAPHLAEAFERYDLFADEFALSCLNRLQLRNNRHMLDLSDPAGALQLAGTLTNPLAQHAGG